MYWIPDFYTRKCLDEILPFSLPSFNSGLYGINTVFYKDIDWEREQQNILFSVNVLWWVPNALILKYRTMYWKDMKGNWSITNKTIALRNRILKLQVSYAKGIRHPHGMSIKEFNSII